MTAYARHSALPAGERFASLVAAGNVPPRRVAGPTRRRSESIVAAAISGSGVICGGTAILAVTHHGRDAHATSKDTSTQSPVEES